MDTRKLRQKILDLAIRGKLVPQDPNDEPASVLLERIKAEKEQLIKEGKIKRTKKTTTSDKSHYENIPFEIPEGWVWCTTDDLAYVASGSTPSKDAFVKKGIPYIKMYNLRKQSIDFDFQPQYIKEEVHNGKLQRSKTKVGDLIMNIVGPPLGKLAIIPPTLPESNFNQAAVLIRPHLHKDIIVQYLFYYLSEMSEINSISTKGSAGQLNISLTQSQNMRIALPPLNEQKRIIAEIKKWNNIIEIIESEKDDIEKSIIKTKSKILDLAIQGKLVPQDPTDEPAINLLKCINPNFEPCDNSHYENLPNGWSRCTISDIAFIQNGFAFQSSKYEEKGVRIIRITNVQKGYIDDDSPKYYPFSLIKYLDNYILKEVDLLMSLTGNVGRVGLMPKSLLPAALNQRVCCIKPKSDEINKMYLYFLFQSERFVRDCIASGKGVAQLNVSTEWLKQYSILLPPIQEQNRIVEIITKFYNAIDTITAEL